MTAPQGDPVVAALLDQMVAELEVTVKLLSKTNTPDSTMVRGRLTLIRADSAPPLDVTEVIFEWLAQEGGAPSGCKCAVCGTPFGLPESPERADFIWVDILDEHTIRGGYRGIFSGICDGCSKETDAVLIASFKEAARRQYPEIKIVRAVRGRPPRVSKTACRRVRPAGLIALKRSIKDCSPKQAASFEDFIKRTRDEGEFFECDLCSAPFGFKAGPGGGCFCETEPLSGAEPEFNPLRTFICPWCSDTGDAEVIDRAIAHIELERPGLLRLLNAATWNAATGAMGVAS